MTRPSLKDLKLPVVLVESADSIRGLMSNVFKQFGFPSVMAIAKPEDLLSLIAYEKVGWIIGGPSLDANPNLMHILSLTSTHPALRDVLVSFFLEDTEKVILPKAFEMGLLSYHPKNFTPTALTAEFNALFDSLKQMDNETAEYSSQQLRRYLRETNKGNDLVALEESFSALRSSSPLHLKYLAEANAIAGKKELAQSQMQQVITCFPEMKESVEKSAVEVLGQDWQAGLNSKSIFGDLVCHILTGQPTLNDQIKAAFDELGIANTAVYSSGKEYIETVRSGTKPHVLLFDWNLADTENVILIQMLQEIEGFDANILIFSDFVDPVADKAILRELGVFGTVKAPIIKEAVGKEILRISREMWFPKAGETLEFKLRMSIKRGDISTAEQVLAGALQSPDVSEGQKLFMSAQVQFAKGDVKRAAKEAMKSVEKMGDSIATLNFLGKCMMILGKFEVAVSCYDKANELAPGSIERLCQLSMAKLESNDASGAEVAISEAKAIAPDSQTVAVTEATQQLRTGDVEKARGTLSQLKSHLGVGSTLNNSAVANVKAGKLTDAFQLYERAAEALPDNMKQIRGVIQYNHALAIVKSNGDLGKASELLGLAVETTTSEAIQSKSKSLLKRLKEAQDSGESIKLSQAAVAEVSVAVGEEVDVDELLISSPAIFRPGDKGLLGIFVQQSEVDPILTKALANPPRFVFRKAIERAESLAMSNMGRG